MYNLWSMAQRNELIRDCTDMDNKQSIIHTSLPIFRLSHYDELLNCVVVTMLPQPWIAQTPEDFGQPLDAQEIDVNNIHNSIGKGTVLRSSILSNRIKGTISKNTDRQVQAEYGRT